MSKIIKFDKESREGLQRGVDQLANAVKVTLGPKGRNVIIERPYGAPPKITKDGVTVALEIELEDVIENMGAQMVKSVASKTLQVVGDGTTTSCILAQCVFNYGIKNITAGANPMDIKRGIDRGVIAVVKQLESMSTIIGHDIPKIQEIATISANNDKDMGKLIADAMEAVGREGVITVENSKTVKTYMDVVEGMKFYDGLIHPAFVTNKVKMITEYENPYILLYDKKITNFTNIRPIIEKVLPTGRPMVIIAEDVDGDALAFLVTNNLNGNLRMSAVKAPEFGITRDSILEDIAILTGGRVVSEQRGYELAETDLSFLGQCESIVITRDSTTIINGSGKKIDIDARVNQIKTELSDDLTPDEKDILLQRIAKLSGGIAVLYIGAATEVEIKEKRDRIDDALHATRAAVEEGIVPGGGVAYLRCLECLDSVEYDNEDQKTGIDIIRKSLREPIKQILINNGEEGSGIISKIIESENKLLGYNALTDKYEEDMIGGGVIDPTKVARVALENAASVAGLLLTTECVIAQRPEPINMAEESKKLHL